MKDPLGVSPSKGNQGTTQGKKIFLTSVGIEPTTSRFDLPLLCPLSYEIGQIVLRGTTFICTLTFSLQQFTTIIVPDFLCLTS